MAIFWISGNSGAGKTTLAKALIGDHSEGDIIFLDGDSIRHTENNRDFSKEGRWKHCLSVAKKAYQLSEECYTVIVAVIAPYKELRKEIKKICNCTFIYLPEGETPSTKYPYEWPNDEPVTAFRIYIQKQ